MQLLTTLLSCLLSLFGVGVDAGTTRITRLAEHGQETLFSKTTQVGGVATFECLASAGDGCHYRIWEDSCEANADAAAPAACRQQALDAFALTVGQRRRVEGLPAGFRHCVALGDGARCS